MSLLDALNGLGISGYSSLDEALKSGDMESILLTLGVERVEALDDLVANKIEEMDAAQEDLGYLSDLDSYLTALDGEDGETIVADEDFYEWLDGYCDDNPEFAAQISDYISWDSNVEYSSALEELSSYFDGVSDVNGELITDDPTEIAAITSILDEYPDFLANAHGSINCYDADGNSIYLAGDIDWDSVVSIEVEHWNGNTLSSLQSYIDSEISTADANKTYTISFNGDSDDLESLQTILDNEMDSLTSNDQLEMVELNSYVNKQTNAYELLTTILSKFQDVISTILQKF